jgi:hypothetical protein
MKRSIAAALCAALAGVSIVAIAPRQAAADTNYWVGYVVHVSTANIKVENKEKTQTLGFLILPKFKQVFSDDGKTTYQMAQIKPGMIVRVVYDQDLFGARHADKIFILNANGQPLKAMGS